MTTDALRVEVVWSDGPDHVERRHLSLPPGALLRDALAASGRAPNSEVGVWGRLQPLEHPLRDRDRVELYRPLTVDPKEARRLRYKGQRAARVKR